MRHSTTKTYTVKRSILKYGDRIFGTLTRAERKFAADMTYGMLAAGSCLLTRIVDELHEETKKINAVERLGLHLKDGIQESSRKRYLEVIREWMPEEPVVLVDDSDVVKPEGYKFESLGIVRDGSESTDKKNIYKKGYHVTEAVALTRSKQPVSIFSQIHSSAEKDYISANAVTFEAIREGIELFGKATFVMDRGYDDNKIFLMLDDLEQYYVIRLLCHKADFKAQGTLP